MNSTDGMFKAVLRPGCLCLVKASLKRILNRIGHRQTCNNEHTGICKTISSQAK